MAQLQFDFLTVLLANLVVRLFATTVTAQEGRRINTVTRIVVGGDVSSPDDATIRSKLWRDHTGLDLSTTPVYRLPIADFMDKSALRVPFLGTFRFHHRHYECGVQPKSNANNIKPVKIETKEVVLTPERKLRHAWTR